MSFLLECAMLEAHRKRRGYADLEVTKVSLVSFIPSLRVREMEIRNVPLECAATNSLKLTSDSNVVANKMFPR
jgi:hypothetical protein